METYRNSFLRQMSNNIKRKGLFLHLIFIFALSILQGQNVGIGITNPERPLHINSPTSEMEILRIQSGNANGSFLSIWNNAGRKGFLGTFDLPTNSPNDFKLGTYPGTGGKLQFMTETQIRMSILPNGYVGIGTEDPLELLDVAGNLNLSGAIIVGDNSSTPPTAGTIRFHNGDFIGYNGVKWHSLTNEKVILGVSDTLIKGGGFQINGFTGLEALNEVCRIEYPDYPTARFYFEDDISKAIGQGNVSSSIFGIATWCWAGYGASINNCRGMGHPTGHLGFGTTISVIQHVDSGGMVTVNESRKVTGVSCGTQLPIICGK